MIETIPLQLFSESRLDHKAHCGQLTYNPSIELFAGAAGPKHLQVWRSNGQVVAKSSQRGDKETVQALRWKADGQFLAVGWSDGVVRLMGLESSKAVHQMPVCEPGKSQITCIGWAQNNVGRRSSGNANTANASWEDLASRGLDAMSKKPALDLPRELTFLELETALPKISPLPASGGSGDDSFVFTTRASLEFLFRPFSPEDSDKADIMVVGTDNGDILVSIYDSFIIGSFNYKLPGSPGDSVNVQLHRHSSNPDISTHMLVFRPTQENAGNVLYLVPMDLTFIHSSPENLSLLASKTTTLQKLLRYLKQVQMHMVHEWQSTRELPSRFLKSINETLREVGVYGEMNIGPAMYHGVVTGHTFPEVKEWLVDELAERGHKRWDKAVVTGLQTLRGLVHENFLPALERIGILLSRLLGIARFHEFKSEIGFSSAQIRKLMDIVTCLVLVGNKILLIVMEELELFRSFSIWLRHEIDHLASSSQPDELTEKEATMEHGKVIAYIQQYMPASPLRFFLSNVSAEDSDRDSQKAETGSLLTDLLAKQFKRQEANHSDVAVYSQIEFLCSYLGWKSNVVFEGIAEAERRNVRFGQPAQLQLDHRISKLDVTMSPIAGPDASQAVTFTALMSEEDKSNVYLFRTSTTIINGISGNVATEVSCVTLGDGKIVDLKFLYDDSLLVLWSSEGEPFRLIRVPHKSEDLGFRAYKEGDKIIPQVLANDQVTSVFLNMTIPSPSGSDHSNAFRPAHMEVKEASYERGKLPPRICLLGDDLQTYRVFELPEDPFKEVRTIRQQ